MCKTSTKCFTPPTVLYICCDSFCLLWQFIFAMTFSFCYDSFFLLWQFLSAVTVSIWCTMTNKYEPSFLGAAVHLPGLADAGKAGDICQIGSLPWLIWTHCYWTVETQLVKEVTILQCFQLFEYHFYIHQNKSAANIIYWGLFDHL